MTVWTRGVADIVPYAAIASSAIPRFPGRRSVRVGGMSYIRLILPDENDVSFEGVVPPDTYTTNNGEYVLVGVSESVESSDDAAGHHEVAVTHAFYERTPTV